MRGGTLSILSHRVKGQIQLLHPVYKTLCTRYRLQSDRFQTSFVNCGWWEREPYWFWVTGSKVKVIFGTLHVKPCGQNTGYTFCPITCKLQMQVVQVMRGETLLILDQGVKAQRTACEKGWALYQHRQLNCLCTISWTIFMNFLTEQDVNFNFIIKMTSMIYPFRLKSGFEPEGTNANIDTWSCPFWDLH